MNAVLRQCTVMQICIKTNSMAAYVLQMASDDKVYKCFDGYTEMENLHCTDTVKNNYLTILQGVFGDPGCQLKDVKDIRNKTAGKF